MAKAKKSKTKSSSLVKDFDKQKTKLGKGKKPAAVNATNTSFKAKSIALTQQSITKDRSALPTSKRNLTTDELIAQTRHYSASVRRDALTGLKEIYQSHDYLAVRHLGLVVPNVSRLISDEDATVRAALHSFLAFYLPIIPPWALRPYASTLLLFTTSSMSHIYPDIRLDAVRILDLLLSSLGVLVSSSWQEALASTSRTSTSTSDSAESNQGHGDRVLRCYLSLLGISLNYDSSTSTNSGQVVSSDLAPGARLLILRSMHSFFQFDTPIDDRGSSTELKCPIWFWDPCFASLPELADFQSCLKVLSDEVAPDNIFAADETCLAMSNLESTLGKNWNNTQINSSLDSIMHLSDEIASPDDAAPVDSGNANRQLFRLISPLLISVFLDAAPSAFSPNEQPHSSRTLSTSARLVYEIAGLTLALWRGTTHTDSTSRDCLGRLLSHMAAYFPFGNEWDESARADMVDLNLAYCELVGLLAVTQNKKRKKEEASTAKQLSNVSDFVVNLLHEEGRQDRVRQPVLRGQTYVDLLPTIWLLLNGKDSRDCTSTIEALLSHWNSLKANDPTKRVGAEFIGRLWLLPLQKSYTGTFTIRPSSPHRASLVTWLTQLVPRYLWELHGKDSSAKAMIVELLRIVACQSDGLIIKDKELDILIKPLTPFFQIRHATKGPIAGPYTRLPSSVQRAARGLLKALPSIDAALQDAAAAVGAWS